MKKLMFVLSIALAAGSLTGCSKKEDASLGKLAAVKEKICACKDQACMSGVLPELAEARLALAQKENPKADELNKAIQDCQFKAMAPK